ncbi:hypothetical protein PM082_022369 [Marasmius tenuissimus]|nr:hypothetical protein PM082_022369 [Marasmius tenuissimus]
MPLGIVYEIPYLLRLARTSKKLRELLMTRSSESIWKKARTNVEVPVPDPLPDLIGDPKFCQFLLPKSEQLVEEYLSLREPEAESWLAKRVEAYDHDRSYFELWHKWSVEYGDQREQGDTLARLERYRAVMVKMKESGWSRLALDHYRFREHRLVNQPKLLTERSWKLIKGKLEEIVVPMQSDLLKRAQDGRFSVFIVALKEWEPRQTFHSVVPPPHIVALWPPIRSFIEDLPLATWLRLPMYEDMLGKLPPLLEDYNERRTKKVLEALRCHEPHASKEDLYKASSLFRCLSPGCSNRTYGYPGILTHACTFTGWDDGRPEVLRLPAWHWSTGSGESTSDTAEIVLDKEAKEMTNKIAKLCGVQGPSSMKMLELFRINPVVECATSACHNFGEVMRWTRAVSVASQSSNTKA